MTPDGTPEAPRSPVSHPAPDDTARASARAHGQAEGHAGADLREHLGRLVREVWVNWAREQHDVADHPSWTAPWGELTDRDREVDMRIGEAVANYALTENAVTWGTSCTSCAKILDSAYAETVRREKAEEKLSALRSVLLEGGQDDAGVRRRAIVITGTEAEADADRSLSDRMAAMEETIRASERELVALELAGLKDALRRHLPSFIDPNNGEAVCGGCLEPSPCPDADLCGESS